SASRSLDRGQHNARAVISSPERSQRSAMSKREDVRKDDRDPLDPSAQVPSEIPAGLDRRKFIMRSAVISAAAVMNGCARSETEQKAPPPAAEAAPKPAGPDVPLSADLNVVMKEKGPVLTTADEFYKVG